jgi:four helix bundle protein
MMGDYKELLVWKQAHRLALDIYRGTQQFPHEERYGLVAQMRRAALSVVSNIAEGSGRQSDREQSRFLRIARGSVHEVQCQLLISRDLGFLTSDKWLVLDGAVQEISKMIHGLVSSLDC